MREGAARIPRWPDPDQPAPGRLGYASGVAARCWGGQTARFSGWRLIVKEGDVQCGGHGGHDGCRGACMGSCRYEATPDGPRLVECTWP